MDTVGAGTVPRHPNEEGTIVAVIGGPPVLRSRHHLLNVLLQRLQVECLERLCVIEILAPWDRPRVSFGEVLSSSIDSATIAGWLRCPLERDPLLGT